MPNIPIGPITGINGRHYGDRTSFLSAEDAIRYIIRYIGDDPDREDLIETPSRVIKSWLEIFAGYHQVPELKWFRSEAQEMVVVRDIDFWSTCEHHMLPFFGVADVGYFPNGFVLGMSKIPRLVDTLARRLQVQERVTEEICKALTCDNTLGAAVIMRAKHACAMCRGAKQAHSHMESTSLTGKFLKEPAARMEFMQGVGRNGI